MAVSIVAGPLVLHYQLSRPPSPPPSMSSLLPLNLPVTIPALSQVKLMLSGTVSALLESTTSYLFVAATVLKMGERHVTTSCSANNTMIVKV